jgi:hypothetical protein
MCLPQKQEEIKQDQFTDKGYSGRNDIWISAPDPDAERVYEGTNAPVATKIRRYYLGNRFAEANAERKGSGVVSPLGVVGSSYTSQRSPFTMVGNAIMANDPTASPQQQAGMRSQPAPRKRYEIVLENGYDDPNVENLTGDFYTNWARNQAGAFSPKVDNNTMPTVERLVEAENKAAADAAKRPLSIGNIYQRSMKTGESRYKDLNATKRDGVTNYVART